MDAALAERVVMTTLAAAPAAPTPRLREVVRMPVRRDCEFSRQFPAARSYVSLQYVVATESEFGGGDPDRVPVDTRLTPVSTYELLSLPCFVERA
jgi:hypothetical protein